MAGEKKRRYVDIGCLVPESAVFSPRHNGSTDDVDLSSLLWNHVCNKLSEKRR